MRKPPGRCFAGPGSVSVCRDQMRLTMAKLLSPARKITRVHPEQAATELGARRAGSVIGIPTTAPQ